MPGDMAMAAPNKHLPWWTWVLPLPVFFIGTLISLEAKITTGTSLFYFPLPLALILTYWWGPRVLVAFYVNAVGCAGLWGLSHVQLWPIYALPEVVFVFLSWLLFVKLASGKVELPDTKQVIYFLVLGIFVPLMVYKVILEFIFLLAGDAPSDKYWNLFITTGFGDFISAFGVSIPLLLFLGGPMAGRGLLRVNRPVAGVSPGIYTLRQWAELLGLAGLGYLINHYLSFIDYWYLNGLLSLYVAIRFGIAATILMNSYILVITYFIPAGSQDNFSPELFLQSNMLKTQLGTCLLYVFTTITGRMVSDMRLSEQQLSEQNKELNLINSEMDRFVYSVSHDLSAPLKSILGLVSLSRMTDKESDHRLHFDLVEKSVNKLEAFVSEVLDYSRNKRGEILLQEVNLMNTCLEVCDDLKFMEGFNEMNIDLKGVEDRTIVTDRGRLKIILRNIVSNAIKFRKKRMDEHTIRFYTESQEGRMALCVEDNGEGIKPEFQSRIFDMFFRGTDRSNGSGLGLYIAREAAKRINARIFVKSILGQGSTFGLEFLQQ
jgi:two-component system, sensor histidine kinase